MNKVLAEVRKMLAANGMPDAEIAQVTAPVAALTQPDRVSALALKDPNVFFLVTGGSFVPGEPNEYIDRETGWPTHVRFERSIAVGASGRVERLLVTAVVE